MATITVDALFDDCGREVGYIAKGDHAIEKMVAAIRHYGETQHGPLEPLATYEFDQAKHEIFTGHYRYIPGGNGTPHAYYLHRSKAGRGAFLATVLYLKKFYN